MALTPSSMIPLGTLAPDFTLLDVVSEKIISLHDIKSPIATVMMFICNHCPFVQHIQDKLVEVATHYQRKGIVFVAINANDAEHYVQDGPDKMKIRAAEKHFPFPYLFDETQQVAKNYHAECTPDFFVFDGALSCMYRGQFDSTRPKTNTPATGQDLCDALDAILSGKKVSADQKPSIGCNIKWK